MSDEFGRSLLHGLRATPKFAEPKWFYDEQGSVLFDEISRTEDYYPTRTEIGILERDARAIAEMLGPDIVLLEPGAGSVVKVRYLLNVLDQPRAYVPMDISGDHLAANAATFHDTYPDLRIEPFAGDFTKTIALPETVSSDNVTIFFPGSTIGNFEPVQARALLTSFAAVPGAHHLILGADLRKNEATLLRAYDDREGTTAAFNLNLLARANRELGADFNLRQFAHRVRYNREHHRIEMHLESLGDQEVTILGDCICFAAGETIHTENSYKYDEESLSAIATAAGWSLRQRWLDDDRYFGIFLFEHDRA